MPLGLPGGTAEPVPLGGFGAVTAHAGVQLQVDASPWSGTGNRVQVVQPGNAEFDIQPYRRGEVGIQRIEPAQDGLGQARGAQRPSLVNAGDAQAGRATGQGGTRDVDLAMAEAVGFDHRHQLAGRTGFDGAHVGGDSTQVDLKGRLRPQRQQAHRNTGPYSAAPAPVARAQ